MKKIITILILSLAPGLSFAGFSGGTDKNKVNLTTDQTVCGNKTFCSSQTIFNGKVGISTTAIPSEALVVEGNGIITGKLFVNGVDVSSSTAAGKVDKAGDTMTGPLVITSTITADSYSVGYERIINVCGSATTCQAVCTGTKQVISGSCSTNPMVAPQHGYPSSATAFTCETNGSANITAYAICGQFE